MTKFLSIFFASLWLLTTAFPASSMESEKVDTGKVLASLVSTHDKVEPGQSFKVALRTVLDKDWHTYWLNPGDSGEPVQISWTLPDGVSLNGALTWPLPGTIATGPIINYGFEGAPLFPQAFQLADNIPAGTVLSLKADAYYLVCKDICIPEQAELRLNLEVGPSILDNRWNDMIRIAESESPKLGAISGAVTKTGSTLELTFTELPESADFKAAYFFPFDQGVLAHSEPQNIVSGTKGLSLSVPSEFLWEKGTPSKIDGVLRYVQDGEAVGEQVSLTIGSVLDIGVRTIAPLEAGAASSFTMTRLVVAIVGAFLGGLILNLMPCVFPVISIKALSIAKSAHGERAKIRQSAWLYTFGVLATFLGLVGVLLALKAGGSEIGWGFQLQSPKLVAALALLMFIIGLNLLGVFEIGTALQNTGSSLVQDKPDSKTASFLTGALAVIVATPCSAPFMAGAVGYALAQPAYVTLAVFTALALGFALPFLLIAYVPSLLSKLPKPGPWMVSFREILAFPMFAAAIWLVWVLSLQAGDDGVLKILMAMLVFALALWLLKRRASVVKVLGGIALLLALALPFIVSAEPVERSAKMETQAWSLEKVAALRAEGQGVFVDFTAAWCVTCKVNEKLVFNQSDVKTLFAETNTAFLIADWTNKDDNIARELAKHGRSGVPLYLYFTPGQDPVSPVILPQVLTKSVLEGTFQNPNR